MPAQEAAEREKEKRESNGQWEELEPVEEEEEEELRRLCPDSYRTMLDASREEEGVRDLHVSGEGGCRRGGPGESSLQGTYSEGIGDLPKFFSCLLSYLFPASSRAHPPSLPCSPSSLWHDLSAGVLGCNWPGNQPTGSSTCI